MVEPTKNGTGFDKHTKVLTKKGWKLIKNLREEDLVCTVDSRTFQTTFKKPLRLVYNPFKGKLFTVDDEYLNLAVTPDKRIFAGDCNSNWNKNPVKTWSTISAQDMDSESTRQMVAAYTENKDQFSPRLARLIGLSCYKSCMFSLQDTLLVPVMNKKELHAVSQLGYSTAIESSGIMALHVQDDKEFIEEYLLKDRSSISLPGDIYSYSQQDVNNILDGVLINTNHASRTKSKADTKKGFYWAEYTGHPFSEELSILCAMHGISLRVGNIHKNPQFVQKFNPWNLVPISYYAKDNKATTDWKDYDGLVYSLKFFQDELIIVQRQGLSWVTFSN